MDKKDMFSYFLHLRQNYSYEEIQDLFNNENYDINKLIHYRLDLYKELIKLKAKARAEFNAAMKKEMKEKVK